MAIGNARWFVFWYESQVIKFDIELEQINIADIRFAHIYCALYLFWEWNETNPMNADWYSDGSDKTLIDDQQRVKKVLHNVM